MQVYELFCIVGVTIRLFGYALIFDVIYVLQLWILLYGILLVITYYY